MTVTVNLRKMLHKKTTEYLTPLPVGSTLAGGFMISDRDGFLVDNDCLYVGGVSGIWNYQANEDSWMPLPNSGIAGTFGAGAAGALRPTFAPSGNSSATASGGTTTTINSSITASRKLNQISIRVIAGTGLGYSGVVTKNTLGPNSIFTVAPASSTAFDNTTVFQIMSGSLWFFNPSATAPGFSVYDALTSTWTARSVANIAVPFGSDGVLLSVHGAIANSGQGFVSGVATSATTTTITDSSKTWPVNGWTNSQVRIVSGTGIGQIRSIISNTATALTVSSWTVTPDATSNYRIEANDDYLYLLGNASAALYRYSVSANSWTLLTPSTARAGVAGIGCTASFIDQMPTNSEWTDGTYGAHYSTTVVRQLGRYIYSFRGGATNLLDIYDIAANTWINALPYGSQMETFTTGTSAVDLSGIIYIQKDNTGRIYQFNVAENSLKPFTTNPVPQGVAVAGNKLFITTFNEGSTKIRFLYSLSQTRPELVRWLII